MLARLHARSESPAASALKKASHLLIIAPAGIALPTLPLHDVLKKSLARRRKTMADLGKGAVTVETADGALVSWVTPDAQNSAFEQHTLLRKAVGALLAEQPDTLTIVVTGAASTRRALAERIDGHDPAVGVVVKVGCHVAVRIARLRHVAGREHAWVCRRQLAKKRLGSNSQTLRQEEFRGNYLGRRLPCHAANPIYRFSSSI